MFIVTAANRTTALARLIRAMDNQQPVTITVLKEKRDETGRVIKQEINGNKVPVLVETVRTIETYDLTVTDAGDIVLDVMDRETGEARRFRLDRIRSLTVHRSSHYTVERTEDTDKPHTRPTLQHPAADAPLTVIYLDPDRQVTHLADQLAA